MIDNIKNETDKLVGKMKEKAGRFLDDDELELKGKVQSVKSDINQKIDDIKDEIYEKTNDIIDKVNREKRR